MTTNIYTEQVTCLPPDGARKRGRYDDLSALFGFCLGVGTLNHGAPMWLNLVTFLASLITAALLIGRWYWGRRSA